MGQVTRSKTFRVLSAIALVLVTAWFLLALFKPQLHYRAERPTATLESQEFWRMLESLADSRLHPSNRIQVLPNGENYYQAELNTIAQAQHSIHLEMYIFYDSEIGKRFVAAIAERARAGVQVRMVIDAIGSLNTGKDFFKPITDAGGKVNWYHPVRWYNWDRANNRTHRELIVIDGRKAFVGGAGVADHWLTAKDDKPRWRDTMVFIEGPAVAALQGTFVENWLESSGEVISDPAFFPIIPSDGTADRGESAAMVVNSSASVGGSTRARILFQTLLASAKSTIIMSTPYFLPDGDARNDLIKAVKRGVSVKIITPGKQSDHAVTRSSSRRLYGDLLKNGIEIYEYQPTMIHAKILVVDGKWSVVGSTNMDNRSFELNDEVNLAAFDGGMSRRLTEDFNEDLRSSRRITYDEWKNRPWRERLTEGFGWLIERQQ
ncbi:MAG TPA: phospholipase D-like domain-containing protein [Terriglobales bacterium]|nr:phospholipase D-like domain-containing protein [Terriglobales bacterium]